MESLREIQPDEWSIWEQYFETEWPRRIPALNLLKMQTYWIQQKLPNPMKFYAPYGNMSQGLVALNWNHAKEVFIFAVNNTTDILERALLETKLIDWTNKISISHASNQVFSMIKERVLPKIGNVNVTYRSYFGFYQPKELIVSQDWHKKLSGIEIKTMTVDYLEVVNSSHPRPYPGIGKHCETLVKAGLGQSIFKDGEFAGFMFMDESGFKAHLFVFEKFRRKNFAEILIKFCSEVSELIGLDNYGNSLITNHAATALYLKIGGDTFGIMNKVFLEPVNRNSKL